MITTSPQGARAPGSDGASRIGPTNSAVTALLFVAALAIGALLGVEPRLALLLGVFVALVVLGVGGFESVLHVLLISVFIESVSLGGSVRVGRVVATGAMLAIGLRLVVTRWRPARFPPRSWLAAALLVAWAWASAFWARDIGPWKFTMGQLALAICFFIAFAVLVEARAQVRDLLRTYAVAALAAGVWGFYQLSLGARATGLQGDPNLYAMYQVAAVAAAVGLARSAPPRAARLWYLSLIPLAASVVASGSRGGLASLVVVSACVVGRRGIRAVRPGSVLLGVVAVVVALTVALSVPAISRRLNVQRVQQDRGTSRLDIWIVAWRSAERHPWLGLGAGNFRSHSLELLEREPGVQLVQGALLLTAGLEVHNVYLEMLAEYGVPGLLLFLGVLITVAWGLRRARRRARDDPAIAALTGMLVAFAVGSIFLSVANNKLLWALVGLAAALVARPRVVEPRPSSLMLSPR